MSAAIRRNPHGRVVGIHKYLGPIAAALLFLPATANAQARPGRTARFHQLFLRLLDRHAPTKRWYEGLPEREGDREVIREFTRLVLKGARRLPSDALLRRSKAQLKVVLAANDEWCALFSENRAGVDEVQPFARITDSILEEMLDSHFEAADAELTNVPEPKNPTSAQRAAVIQRMVESWPGAEQDRFLRISGTYERASSTDRCWYSRKFTQGVLDAPKADQPTLLRTQVSDPSE